MITKMSKIFTKRGFKMKVKLIYSTVFDDFGTPYTSYGIAFEDKCYYDISLNKELIEKFVEFLNNDEAPAAEIEVIIEDLLS